EARIGDIEIRGCEIVRLRIGVQELDIGDPRLPHAALGVLQHGGRDVDAEDPSSRSDTAREVDRRAAAAAADVEHLLAGANVGPVHRALAERAQLLVELALVADPFRRGALVPEGDLLGVRTGGGEWAHESLVTLPRRDANLKRPPACANSRPWERFVSPIVPV